MLDRAKRFALTAAAFAAFAGAYATAPLAAHGWFDPPAHPQLSTALPAPAMRDVVIVPARDPFDAPGARAGNATEPAPARAHGGAALPAIPPVLGPLPPNAGALGAAPPAAVRVAAIVTGARAYALVDEGATTRLVAPGDTLGGVPIVAIDAAGVRLRGGTVIPPTLPPSGGRP